MTAAGTVVVTGAARGIGRATAEAFRDLGWSVWALDLTAPDVAGVRTGVLDVTDPDAWTAVLAEVGELDALVNNAGVLVAGRFSDLPARQQAALVDVNVKGVLYGCHAASPHLRRGSVVVNLASASAMYGTPSLAVYSATKSAVAALTEALDLEWDSRGIRVLDLQPLFVHTGMGDVASQTPSGKALGVHLQPAEVAQAVVDTVLRPGSRLRGPHRVLGRQARALSLAGRFAPPGVTRALTGRLAR